MVIGRNLFFTLLFSLLIGPLIIYKVLWISSSVSTKGVVWFEGHTLEVQGISSHPVIKFKLGKDSLFFNSATEVSEKPGSVIPIRYQKTDPGDGKVATFYGLWMDTIIYSLFPFLILCCLYFTPQKFDPLIPRHSRVKLGGIPFVKILS